MNSPATSLAEVLSPPKGGGALRGIGETFAPDLHTGTGNFSVPIALPDGRNGLKPSLTLTFSTGLGNGGFGMGWSLGIPAVTCLTSKGIPRYAGKDTFVLSGAEELVPIGAPSAAELPYRPRTEGLFARIAHITDEGNYWRVATKDGLISLYGQPPKTPERNANLVDPDAPSHLFAWYLNETRDPFGNRIVYDYRQQRDQTNGHDGVQTYPKRIRYVDLPAEGKDAFFVSVTFLYDDEPPPAGVIPEAAAQPRPDPFSEYRAGFEIRTARRCKWIVIQTHPTESPAIPVRAYELIYKDEQDPGSFRLKNRLSLLARINVIGFDDSGRGIRELPPLDFDYSRFEPTTRRFRRLEGPALPADSLANPNLELVDLFGNGLPDLLQLSADGARCWRNLGQNRFDWPRPLREVPAGVSLADRGVQIIDADGDGRADLLVSNAQFVGDYPLNFTGRFNPSSFRRYTTAPSFNLEDPQVRLLDLTGDGVSDVLRTGPSFECFFSDGELGFAAGGTRRIPRGRPQEFPDVNFADPRVKLGDLSGDGLQDIALIHTSRVDYWPNRGYGRFGSRLTMPVPEGLPVRFDPERVLLGDVDGDGLADLIYVSDREVTLWLNCAGNRWSLPIRIQGTPPMDGMATVRVIDLEGTGVSGLLWTRQARLGSVPEHYFLEFTGGTKPYLLIRMENNLGAITEVSYAPSTKFYLKDQEQTTTRWRTNLPFPVHVVERVIVRDALSEGMLSTEYRYHHGYRDGVEREYRGFGMVEQLDTEVFASYEGRGLLGDTTALERLRSLKSYSPPLLTRTWFHQGAVDPPEGGPWRELEFRDEYWPGDRDPARLPCLPEGGGTVMDHRGGVDAFLAGLPRRVQRDALRTLRGRVLRRETYALDGSPLEDRPYTVSEYAYALREIDPPEPGSASNRQRIFFPHAVAERTTQWERGEDPQSRYGFSGDYDAYGQARLQVAIACPRGWRDEKSEPIEPYLATLNQMEYAAVPEGWPVLADRVIRSRTYELLGTEGATLIKLLSGLPAWPRQLFGESLTYYDGDAFQGLGFGTLGRFGMAVRSETLVMSKEVMEAAYGEKLPACLDPANTNPPREDYPEAFFSQGPTAAGYIRHAASATHAGGWYAQTSRAEFDFQAPSPVKPPQGLLLAQRDPLGHTTRINAADYLYGLLPLAVTGPTGMVTSATYNLRVLQPLQLTDPNGNRIEMRYSPSGLVSDTFLRGKAGAEEGDLKQPSLSLRYDLRAFLERGQPVVVRRLQREFHDSDPADSGQTIETREYSDGFGRLLQTRTQGEEVRFGDATFGGGDRILPADQLAELPKVITGQLNSDPSRPNVIVSGWQRYDNKGRVVEKFEPFFDAGWEYEPVEDAKLGQRLTMHYDPRGQIVRTVNPDGSVQLVLYGVPTNLADPPQSPADTRRLIPTPWEAYTYDPNDNAGRTHAGMALHRSYHHHYDTPANIVIDALGRTVRAVARHRAPPDSADTLPPIKEHITRSTYDIQGNLTGIRDALGRLAFAYVYDLAKRPLRIESIDAGRKQTVFDAAGNTIEHRDAKGAIQLRSFDALNRPKCLWARDGAGEEVTLREQLFYGDDDLLAVSAASRTAAAAVNCLGKLVRHDDEAGRVTVIAYDFKGNILESARQVLSDAFMLRAYRAELAKPEASRTWALPTPRVDWANAASEADLDLTYTTRSAYDALNRVVWTDYPQAANGERHRLWPAYNRAGALARIELEGPLEAGGSAPRQAYVEHMAYNAKGQRLLITYGNGLATRYAYEPATFRLARMRTDRYKLEISVTPAYQLREAPLQDITYSYDLAGNILGMQELVPGCGVMNNPEAIASPPALRQLLAGGDALLRRFEYDPLYRLTSATGRECKTIPSPRPWEDEPRCGYNSGNHGTPNQDNAPNLTALYREEYDYDPAGNMLSLRHSQHQAGGRGWSVQWSRRFGMDGRTPDDWRAEVVRHLVGEWADAPSNRLTHAENRAAGVASPPVVPQSHRYDNNGNMIGERNERQFEWDHADRMKSFRNQTGSSRPTTYAVYLYDAAGMRVKKLVVDGGNEYRTTSYLGSGFEHHTEQKIDGSGKLENCSLHVMEGEHRIAMLRVGPAFADDGMKEHPTQYFFQDHLGSSELVVSFTGTWVNRESWSPYGEALFGSFSRKRYRFTAKECDKESDLRYHDARYFDSANCRWLSCDPEGASESINSFSYVDLSPIAFIDITGRYKGVTEVAGVAVFGLRAGGLEALSVVGSAAGTVAAALAAPLMIAGGLLLSSTLNGRDWERRKMDELRRLQEQRQQEDRRMHGQYLFDEGLITQEQLDHFIRSGGLTFEWHSRDQSRGYWITGNPRAMINSMAGYQVYEIKNRSGEILYVGKSGGTISEDPLSWIDRVRSHIKQYPWMTEADTITVKYGLSEKEAFALEEVRIPLTKYNEKPGEYSSRFKGGDISKDAAVAEKGHTAEFQIDVHRLGEVEVKRPKRFEAGEHVRQLK